MRRLLALNSAATVDAPTAPASRGYARALLLLSLAAGAWLRARFALGDDGVYWPDEIYQSLEPAHRLVFGYGYLAWEFVDGARNWTLAGGIAGLLQLTTWLGGDRPQVYLPVIRLFFCALGVATAWAISRLARAQGATPLAAAASAAVFAGMNVALYFAPRALSETAATLPAVLGLALASPAAATRRARLLGACLLGLSVLLRLHCAVLCVALLALFSARRQWRPLLEVSGVLGLWALAYGVMDALTWGGFFHSALAYLRFNLVENKATLFGKAPPAFYSRALLQSLGPLWWLIAGLAVLAARRAPWLLLTALGFYVVHAASPHKELRFLLPFLALATALAGLGLSVIFERWRRVGWGALTAVLLATVASAWGFRSLTFKQLGIHEPNQQSAFDRGGPESRLLLAASRQPDLCGLTVLSNDLGYIGGYATLHRDVPLYDRPGPELSEGHVNYVVAHAGQLPGVVVARDRDRVLLRVRDAPCVPDPAFIARFK